MGCGDSKDAEPAAAPTTQPAAQKTTSAGNAGPQKSEKSVRSSGAKSGPGNTKEVMGKFLMFMGKEDVMGEGTSSICRKGTTIDGKQEVAIKVYKDQAKHGGKVKDVTLQKFKRQIEVLQELLEPIKKPAEKELWHESLEKVKPGSIFMQLLDYSKDAKGQPGPDTSDGVLYVVTELAQYSLKDFLAHRREQKKPLPMDEVKSLAKGIIVAMAGLHAKGYVHIDMKPENMMMFNGKLKVIDVDGCVRKGTKISIQDSSISFSPCYCAPEWARFLIKDSQPNIIANPALDVWSVGMTLCELVTLDAILKPQYANFLRNASSHREAGFLFMEWLSSVRKPPVPRAIEKFDKQFAELMTQWLLVVSQGNRKTCAQVLSNPFILSCPDVEAQKDPAETEQIKRVRERQEDDSVQKPLFQGILWKLNNKKDPKDATQWIQRDMWIAHNHSLCYFSKKEDKRLVLIDALKLSSANIVEINAGEKWSKPFAFEVQTKADQEDQDSDACRLAAESKEDLLLWLKKLKDTSKMDVFVTMKLGAEMAADIDAFKVAVKNRRIKVEEGDAHEQYEPLFKENLWKLKTEGDHKKEEDWFKREMWIAKNGSLVYYSPKEERELVYYTSQDISRAKVEKIGSGVTCKSFAFRVTLPPINSVEFSPGEFAADSDELRQKWLDHLAKFQA